MATLNAETKAILKLDLGDKGGIRRIPLAKLWDPVTSRVSYQRLLNMAIQYRDIAGSKVESVTVTYTDEDGDVITISTDDELNDAFEQFASRVPPVVRAKASFEIEENGKKIVKGLKQAVSEIGGTVKIGDGANQMQDVLDSFMTILTQAVDSFSKNMEGTQQQEKKKFGSRNFQSELRARNRSHKACCTAIKKRGMTRNLQNKVIAEISSTAKDSSQVRVRNRNHKARCSEITRNLQNKVIAEISSKAKADAAQVRVRNRNHKACCSEIQRRAFARNLEDHLEKKVISMAIDDVSSKRKTAAAREEDEESKHLTRKVISPHTTSVKDENKLNPLSPPVKVVNREHLPKVFNSPGCASKVSSEVEKKQKAPSDTFPVAKDSGEAFIHGRHTCDGCGVTPIVGKRFHALNLPDYDLCHKCAQKNSRKDIIFEPTELERDRCFQNKWKRQQLRLNECHELIFGNPAPFGVVDNALVEAISRSLEDLKPNTEASKELANEKILSKGDEEIVPVLAQEQINFLKHNDGDDISYSVTTHASDDSDISDGEQDRDESAPFCNVDDALAEKVRKPDTEEKDESKIEKTLSNLESPRPGNISDDKEEVDALIDEKDGEKVKVFCEEDKVDDEISAEKSNLTMTESNKNDEASGTERVNEQILLSQLKLEKELAVNVAPNLLQNTKGHASVSETSAKPFSTSSLDAIPLPWPDSPPNHKHLSANSGIQDDSSSNSDSDGTKVVEDQGDVLVAKDNDVFASANGAVVCEMGKTVECTNEDQTDAGCTVVGSVNTTNTNDDSEESSQSQSSLDSWQILDENEQASSDEMIAQAAQLLGSALFETDTISDMTEIKNKGTITTDHNSMTEASFAVAATISPVVLSRWDTELKELHELGFLDDEKNVDALGHLEAANMGVNSDDPVTVNDAVNYLLSKYSEVL